MGSRGLRVSLADIQKYLKQVAEGKLPTNHAIIYLLQVNIKRCYKIKTVQEKECYSLGHFEFNSRRRLLRIRAVRQCAAERPDDEYLFGLFGQVGGRFA